MGKSIVKLPKSLCQPYICFKFALRCCPHILQLSCNFENLREIAPRFLSQNVAPPNQVSSRPYALERNSTFGSITSRAGKQMDEEHYFAFKDLKDTCLISLLASVCVNVKSATLLSTSLSIRI